ncbi:hypothetical protein EB796_015529 [Bugula neritina]|uniref:Uncharacterized protein n=1 Tax=Bugula neritina TaxID=10212 RepID=A0A7J7JIM8_BUGNE|nr:hypothetical protein EB796_015529 [Bugula neritina]
MKSCLTFVNGNTIQMMSFLKKELYSVVCSRRSIGLFQKLTVTWRVISTNRLSDTGLFSAVCYSVKLRRALCVKTQKCLQWVW